MMLCFPFTTLRLLIFITIIVTMTIVATSAKSKEDANKIVGNFFIMYSPQYSLEDYHLKMNRVIMYTLYLTPT